MPSKGTVKPFFFRGAPPRTPLGAARPQTPSYEPSAGYHPSKGRVTAIGRSGDQTCPLEKKRDVSSGEHTKIHAIDAALAHTADLSAASRRAARLRDTRVRPTRDTVRRSVGCMTQTAARRTAHTPGHTGHATRSLTEMTNREHPFIRFLGCLTGIQLSPERRAQGFGQALSRRARRSRRRSRLDLRPERRAHGFTQALSAVLKG